MTSRNFLGLVLLLIAVTLASVELTKSPSAQESSKRRWEYCELFHIGMAYEGPNKGNGRAEIRYLQEQGVKLSIVEFERSINSGDVMQGARARAFARLGEEGWELIETQPSSNTEWDHVYRFKRPKT